MKLRTKIAGTLALPLALAVAGATNAATVVDNDNHTLKIGGFVAATADWAIYDDTETFDFKGGTANVKGKQDSDIDFGMSLGVSRLNIAYTQKTSAGDITYLYENDFNKNDFRLRHAAIMYDGYVAGYTWSGFANLTGLAETIDAAGPTGVSANAQRTAVLGKNISVGEDMSVGLFVEDRSHALTTGGAASGRTANTPLPDLVANFKGKFGTTSVFAAAEMIQVDKNNKSGDAKTEAKVSATLGVNSQVTDELNLKLAVSSWDEGVKVSGDGRDLGVLLGAQYKFTDQIRTNLAVEQFVADAKDSDHTAVWVNAFYKMDSGWEWGAELRSVSTGKARTGATANAMGIEAYSKNGGTPDKNEAAAKAAAEAASKHNKVNGLGDKDMMFSLMAKYAF